MAEVYKRLGASAPAATTDTSLYQVPTGKAAVVAELSVCNRGTTDAKFRIAHVDGAIASVANEDYIYYDSPITPKATIEGLLKGKALSQNDSILIYSDSADLSFLVTGAEIV